MSYQVEWKDLSTTEFESAEADMGYKMNIMISNSSMQPIYEQIYTQIKNCILSEEVKEGEQLPSIRTLAKDLRISVITTKRAYDELEQEGYIYTIASKGCFVARKNLELIREENLRSIEEHLQIIKTLANGCGLTSEEIVEMFMLLNE